ncbi:similar to Saccharomyces cerevisiae YGL226C-A OST5 Zeta subunit of the oligosaccharyltransferase complex of the ER lumen [Maudiozyma barnettii]|uniref:Dolichyl-diphosphooligosaccharide-protein glycosyltransferase subunit OST5 n=1 Tax=Maudiozyma barnettii TaxID=61262 RepID=A0A8H2VB18_9SACH|nr:dolichyl-diphosphooligosaccharide--protein glycotransferase subunit [Kazachstania barnettii]CAB4251971.1 similar to Saccharomyces cerevisiae YGL226C-A OST5 Zeta subunit of the oligosaccharyltransferase complex of the ER lumen [Kazachstania barnettii]CAD1778361.1 similar to Saccharomyces cerevisiae YGL226C-A OST5 Zeta subunit of the oligosaccharyltransferase complex of the ER lumen [Kazachstania barnettii]
MGYETLYNEFHANENVQAFIPLAQQPRYGIMATVLALLFLFGAVMTACSKKSIVPKFLIFTFLSVFGSILFAIAAIFVSDAFGVYV